MAPEIDGAATADRPAAGHDEDLLLGAHVVQKARSGVTIRTRRAEDSVIRAAIWASRVLPALVGRATTRSTVTSVERWAASPCEGHRSTSAVLLAEGEVRETVGEGK